MTGEALRAFHERTKHTPRTVRETAHFLDWRNEPSRFKRYRELEMAALPPFEPTGVPAHQAVAASAHPEGDAPLHLEGLSHLLFHAAGVSRTIRSEMGEFHFRTYASAGALYPIEVYVIAGEAEGLDPGVYHYAPLEHGLTLLRKGDFRGNVGLGGAAPGAATLILTGIPWRTAWKYTARGFRHLYWDAGMVMANLLAAAAALGLRARVYLGFVDDLANDVVAVDGITEFALCAVAVGRGETPAPAEVGPLDLEVEPISQKPQRDPLIEEAHRATELASEDEVRSFRERAREEAPAEEADEELFPAVSPLSAEALATDPIEEVIRRRGSSRLFARESIPASEMAAILDRAMAGVPGDWVGGASAVRSVVMAAALERLPTGIHDYRPGGRFRLRREGQFRGEAGYLCLEQRLGADAASVTILFADPDLALGSLGGRGYAATQLEAAIIVGRIYLGAYAQCLGTSGITFYDDDIRRFLETGLEPMLVAVTGPEGRRTSIRRCRLGIERA